MFIIVGAFGATAAGAFNNVVAPAGLLEGCALPVSGFGTVFSFGAAGVAGFGVSAGFSVSFGSAFGCSSFPLAELSASVAFLFSSCWALTSGVAIS